MSDSTADQEVAELTTEAQDIQASILTNSIKTLSQQAVSGEEGKLETDVFLQNTIDAIIADNPDMDADTVALLNDILDDEEIRDTIEAFDRLSRNEGTEADVELFTSPDLYTDEDGDVVSDFGTREEEALSTFSDDTVYESTLNYIQDSRVGKKVISDSITTGNVLHSINKNTSIQALDGAQAQKLKSTLNGASIGVGFGFSALTIRSAAQGGVNTPDEALAVTSGSIGLASSLYKLTDVFATQIVKKGRR